MENKSHAMAAGVFVLFVAALVIALAAWLSRDTTQRDTYEFTTRESISGLSPQAAVRYRGIPVGKVETIAFDKEVKGNVLVRLSVDHSAPVTKATYATLGFQGVTGLAYVQLEEDGPPTEPLATSSSEPARIPLRPSLLSSLSDQGTKLLMEAEDTSKLLNPDGRCAVYRRQRRPARQNGAAHASHRRRSARPRARQHSGDGQRHQRHHARAANHLGRVQQNRPRDHPRRQRCGHGCHGAEQQTI
jgi:hypothetical protein